MLEADRVSIRVARGAVLLDDVSVAVSPGEVLALVGPNGAGKSTLLSIMSGARAPSAGVARLDGHPLGDYPPPELARRRAVLPQASPLSFAFSALDVVSLGRMPAGGGHARRRRDLEAVRSAMMATGVGHLAHRAYPTLSGGEQQRVQLARVLAQLDIEVPTVDGARYLLLDEPTASLDLAHQHETLCTAKRVAHAGAGVLVVVHDLNLAARYADRIAVLKDGRIVTDAPPRHALDEALIEEVFALPVRVVEHPAGDYPLVVAR